MTDWQMTTETIEATITGFIITKPYFYRRGRLHRPLVLPDPTGRHPDRYPEQNLIWSSNTFSRTAGGAWQRFFGPHSWNDPNFSAKVQRAFDKGYRVRKVTLSLIKETENPLPPEVVDAIRKEIGEEQDE